MSGAAADLAGSPFTGLSTFPLTPLRDDVLDVEALRTVVRRLVPAGAGSPGAGAGSSAGPSSDASGGLAGHAAGPVVDSIGALGSTGSYAYLDREEWTTALRTILAEAGTTPVVAGIGALRTREAVARARTAEQLGAAGLLLAPVSYQPLRDSEVLGLFTAGPKRSTCRSASTTTPAPPASGSPSISTPGSPGSPGSRR